MTNKQMVKSELIYLLDERGASVKTLNQAIKEVNACDDYESMLKVYYKYNEITK